MRVREYLKDKVEDIKTHKVVDEVKDHVTEHKVAYLCVVSASAGIVLTMITRRGSKVEVNVSVNLNNFEVAQ